MQHEPECPWTDPNATICICEELRAAYQRGREYQHKKLTNHDMHSGLACLTNYKAGYDEGYRAGYNDHAKSRAYAEQVYGPYRDRGFSENVVVLKEGERLINGQVYVQHGKGENP